MKCIDCLVTINLYPIQSYYSGKGRSSCYAISDLHVVAHLWNYNCKLDVAFLVIDMIIIKWHCAVHTWLKISSDISILWWFGGM